jgi:hypothetical protein
VGELGALAADGSSRVCVSVCVCVCVHRVVVHERSVDTWVVVLLACRVCLLTPRGRF